MNSGPKKPGASLPGPPAAFGHQMGERNKPWACRCPAKMAEGIQDYFATNNLDNLLTAAYRHLGAHVLPALGLVA